FLLYSLVVAACRYLMCSYPEIMHVSMIGTAARHEHGLNHGGTISDRRTPSSPGPNRPAPNSPAATTCDTHHVGSCAPVRFRTGSRSMAKWIAGANQIGRASCRESVKGTVAAV